VLVKKLVNRPAQRHLQQAAEPVGRKHGVLDRDRAAVGQPDPEQVDDQVAAAQAEGAGGGLVGGGQPGAQHPGAGHHALAAQQRGDPDHP